MTETKKLYHSISEVSERLGVKPHVLRYWETQFRWLRPKKNRAGNRSYQEKDLLLLDQIRELLYDRRFTIEGARKELERRRKEPEAGEVGSGDRSPAGAGDGLDGVDGGFPDAAVRGAAAPGPAGDTGGGRNAAFLPGATGGVPAANDTVSPTVVRDAARMPGRGAAPAGPEGEARARRLHEVRTELRGLKEWLESRP